MRQQLSIFNFQLPTKSPQAGGRRRPQGRCTSGHVPAVAAGGNNSGLRSLRGSGCPNPSPSWSGCRGRTPWPCPSRNRRSPAAPKCHGQSPKPSWQPIAHRWAVNRNRPVLPTGNSCSPAHAAGVLSLHGFLSLWCPYCKVLKDS